MNYLLKGNDQFHIEKKINEIISKNNVSEYDIHRYDGKDRNFNIDEIVDDLMTIPIFGGSKVIIFKNPCFLLNDRKNKDEEKDEEEVNDKYDWSSFMEYISNPVYGNELIMYSLDFTFKTNTRVYKEIAQNTSIIEYSLPKQHDFKTEAYSIINRNKLDIDNEAREILITNSAGDYQMLYDNIEKLKIYGGKINADAVNHLTTPYVEDQMMIFTNMLFDKNFKEAFKILNDFYSLNYSIFYIIASLAGQIRFLVKVNYYYSKHYSLNDIKKYTNTSSDYRIKKNIETIRKYEGVNFIKYLYELSKLDMTLKTSGDIDDRIRFELFLINMMEGN